MSPDSPYDRLVRYFSSPAGNLPDTQELMQVLGIDQKELVNLDQGKIVSFDVAEGDEKELAAVLVIYLPATPSKIIQFINKKGLADIDTDVISPPITLFK